MGSNRSKESEGSSHEALLLRNLKWDRFPQICGYRYGPLGTATQWECNRPHLRLLFQQVLVALYSKGLAWIDQKFRGMVGALFVAWSL